MSATQIKKISVAKVFGKVNIKELMKLDEAAKADPNLSPELAVMQVIGVAVGTKTGESDFGDYEALVGTFEATNPAGEVFGSSVCFLPDVALNSVKVGLAMDGAKGVQFALAVTARYDDTSSVHYSYGFRPLLQTANDPIAHIKAQMALQLAGPADAAQEAQGEEGQTLQDTRKANPSKKKNIR